ncbi:hypothetical protein P3W45_000089 [Vairimorpha bombi]|jgi:hypothetical protein
MIQEINNLYTSIQDLEKVLTEYTKSKTDIRTCEMEIDKLESIINCTPTNKLKSRIQSLEEDHKKVLNDIKKIDMCSKECYKISEIRAMFEFIFEKDVLLDKSLNFLNSLIYDMMISKEDFVKYFNPQNYEDFPIKDGFYKIIKISNDLNDLFNILKNEDRLPIFRKCYSNLKDILEDELGNVLIDDVIMYYDMSHVYLIYWIDYQDTDFYESQYFTSMSYTRRDYLSNMKNIASIFYEIFKNNLNYKLLKNETTDKNIRNTNDFLINTEFYITNIDEWKLDCVMKEVIIISKSRKSREYIKSSDERISLFISKIDKKFVPENISEEFFRFLLCMNVFNTVKSKRLEKAIKIIERALFKMMNNEDIFVSFSDITLSLRIFPDLSVNFQLSNLREHLYDEITRKAAELTKNLQESPLMLKVYFKGKHFDFVESLKKFVPKNSQISFEINFFNLLYTNVIDNILCMKFISNDKITDLSDLLKYLIDMSFNISKECINIFDKMNSVYLIFKNDLDDVIDMHKKGKIILRNEDLINLVSLIYKDSKKRSIFISILM